MINHNFLQKMGLLILLCCVWACNKPPVDGQDPGEITLTFSEVIESGGAPEVVVNETAISEPVEQDSLINGESWKCTVETYDITQGNEQFPQFNPNASVIYPGNLLQGASLDKATPDVIDVDRAGGTISYYIVSGNTTSFFEVDEVTKGKETDAMNRI